MKLTNRLMSLNLQFFAEGDPEPDKGDPKTFTQEDLDKIIGERLNKEKSKWQKDYEKKLQDVKTEAEKLANMDAEQRKEAELEQKMLEFETERKAFEIEKSKVEAMKILGERKLNVQLVDFVVGEDAKMTLANINTIEKIFKEAVKEAVDQRLKSDPPKADKPNSTDITKDQFKKMSLVEQSKLYTDNKEIYEKLTKQ